MPVAAYEAGRRLPCATSTNPKPSLLRLQLQGLSAAYALVRMHRVSCSRRTVLGRLNSFTLQVEWSRRIRLGRGRFALDWPASSQSTRRPSTDPMPDISAFRGIRYDLGHVGSLSNVIAPPYDVIDAELQTALYNKHPANVVRLILNRDEPGDDEHNNRYTRAARLLRNWQREGVLFTEAQPAIYVYHQEFTEGGVTLHAPRLHVAACGWSASARATSTRTKRRTAAPRPTASSSGPRAGPTSARSSASIPIRRTTAQNLLEAAILGVAPLEATDHLGRRPPHLAGHRRRA